MKSVAVVSNNNLMKMDLDARYQSKEALRVLLDGILYIFSHVILTFSPKPAIINA